MGRIKRKTTVILSFIMVVCTLCSCRLPFFEDDRTPLEKKYPEFITIDVFDVQSNTRGIQQGWFAKIVRDKFNMQINIIAPNQEGHGTALFENMRASGNIGDIIFIGANDKIKVSWDKAEGVAKYEVYATYCGKKFPKKPTKTTKSTSVTIKKIKDKKIDFTKNFKLYVKAYDSNGNVVGNSVHAHFAGKDHEKYKNPKDIKLGAKTITLDKGQSTKIKASVKIENGKKKALPDDHVAKLRYRSNNQNVAKVDSKGNVTAVGTGTCTVYVYAKNGFAKKVAVTVN